MNLIITGGLGHIGSYVIRKINRFLPVENILIIDSLVTQRYSSLFDLPKGVSYKYLQADIRTISSEEIASHGEYHYLIHLGATTDAAGNADKKDELFSNNLPGTLNAIKICKALSIPLIFPSSTSVYGSQESLVDEECKALLPQSPYAECKLAEEAEVISARSLGLNSVILRLGTIHGISPGMRFHTAVNKFCFQAVNNLPFTVWKTAMHQMRPYLSLSDACAAIAHVIKIDLFNGEVYNIVTANHSVSEIIEEIESSMESKCEIEYVDSKIMNQLSYAVSNKKISSTGFSTSGSLKTDIFETVQLLSGLRNV